MSMATEKKRPKNLDLATIKFPPNALVSILHRISGALLFLIGIPVLLAALQGSLGSPEGFDWWRQFLGSTPVKLLSIGAVWLFVHHLLAGLRFLALDIHFGVSRESMRSSSLAVIWGAIILTVLIGAFIW